MHTPELHHKYGASGRGQWSACPGSIAASRGFADSDSAASIEGTLAHEVAAAHLLGQIAPAHPVEMEHHVENYINYVQGLPGSQRMVEVRISFDEFIPGGFGTADYICLDFENLTIHVADLKYGKGVAVSAQDNLQLETYGLGVLSEFGWMADWKKVVCHIHQPRLGGPDSWSFDASEAPVRMQKIRDEVALASSPDAPRIPGEKQCRFCKFKAHCPELAATNFETMTGYFRNLDEVIEEPFEPIRVLGIPDEHVPKILAKMSLIEGWCAALRERAFEMAMEKKLSGYKIVAGRANSKWDDEEEVIKDLLKAGCTTEDFMVSKLWSPSQAAKALGKKHEVIVHHVFKPPGKPTLVPLSDKREEYDPRGVENMFTNHEGNDDE